MPRYVGLNKIVESLSAFHHRAKVWDPGFNYGDRAQKAEFTMTVDELFAAAHGARPPS